MFPKPKKLTKQEKLALRLKRPIGWRGATKRRNASNYAGLELAKGPTRAEEKRRAHAHKVEVIATARAAVWVRSRDYCEVCSDTEAETARKWHKAVHEMHEVKSRAQMRGRPVEEIFCLENCIRVCGFCHDLLTRNVLELRPHSAAGVNGDFDVISHVGTSPVTTTVIR
jgi:hypothetical protein